MTTFTPRQAAQLGFRLMAVWIVLQGIGGGLHVLSYLHSWWSMSTGIQPSPGFIGLALLPHGFLLGVGATLWMLSDRLTRRVYPSGSAEPAAALGRPMDDSQPRLDPGDEPPRVRTGDWLLIGLMLIGVLTVVDAVPWTAVALGESLEREYEKWNLNSILQGQNSGDTGLLFPGVQVVLGALLMFRPVWVIRLLRRTDALPAGVGGGHDSAPDRASGPDNDTA